MDLCTSFESNHGPNSVPCRENVSLENKSECALCEHSEVSQMRNSTRRMRIEDELVTTSHGLLPMTLWAGG